MDAIEQLAKFVLFLREAGYAHYLDVTNPETALVVVPFPDRYLEVEFTERSGIRTQSFGPSGELRNVAIDELKSVASRHVV